MASIDSGYERVAVAAGVITVSCWAPVGSEWRPAWRPDPRDLHIHIAERLIDEGVIRDGIR